MAACGYFSVKNFERFQHYKNRSPQWIKLYNSTLEDYDFCQLPDASKAHLFASWLLASRYQNRIPADPEWLAKKMGATSEVRLDLLAKAGFIVPDEDCSIMLAERYQHASEVLAQSRVEREKSREEESPPQPDRVSQTHAREPGPASRVAGRFLQMREQLWPQDPYPLASMAIEAEAEAWLADGMAPERIIATFATGMQQMAAQKRAAPNSLRAFGRSLTDVLADVKARGSGAPRANGHAASNGSGAGYLTVAEERESESVKWRVKVQGYLDNGYWPGDGGSGPKPTKPDTQVPLEILAEFATKFSDAGMQVPALGRAPRAKL